EATNFGFIPANNLSPSSSDPSTVGQATNLTSSCSTLTALCQDASGAPWFGGSYKTRPTGSTNWDMGAFAGTGSGGGNPPSTSMTAPTGTISGSSVSVSANCTPQGSNIISSIQIYVDGIPFGALGTTSPYTISLDTTK